MIQDSIYEYCDGKYVWGKKDCVGLLEHVWNISVRQDWMNNDHVRSIAIAKRKYGSVHDAYMSVLKQHGFEDVLMPKIKAVFITQESGMIDICLNNVSHSISLPYSIMGIVAEKNKHLYFGYEGVCVISPKSDFEYLWAA